MRRPEVSQQSAAARAWAGAHETWSLPSFNTVVITVTGKEYHGKRGHLYDHIALCVRCGNGIKPRVRPPPPSVELRGGPKG